MAACIAPLHKCHRSLLERSVKDSVPGPGQQAYFQLDVHMHLTVCQRSKGYIRVWGYLVHAYCRYICELCT